MKISDTLKLALLQRRVRGVRQYEIARAAQVHPTVLSAIVNDTLPIRENDPRVLRVAEVLGVSRNDCFAEDGAATLTA